MNSILPSRTLDLFAGAGGFSRGLQDAGLPTTTAVENFKPVAQSYAENFPDVELLAQDIQKTSFAGRSYDLVVGGPPCEPYTSASSKREENPLDRLYKNKIGGLVLHYVRIVKETKPKVFVMENVVQVAEGPLRPALEKEFRAAGYPTIFFNELHAEHYGTPSHRRRLFISNVKLDLPPTVHPPYKTVDEALAGLPPPGTNKDPNHLPHPLSPDKRRRIANLRSSDALYSYRSGTGRVHGNWMRLRADRLAPTILGNARYVHPTEDRLLTVREHARLMGFPDEHRFRGGRDLQYDQVGEAVPPPLGAAIAAFVRDRLGS